ncbi:MULTISPECIES: potassium-transporting ATPase subunit F [Duganella]|mgnify:CR=1 FL=1|jgi:K+-transporting ATPase KdpF subunit|uniref:Potassium-transporting ATPase subunit F n=1 Tax=Duganella zoogloeoides TaxID=75659 RepID=A0ABZ0XX96_9BURK|nr:MULTISPECIES: potassium-transporting ATPase subunit F [Duganella]KQN79369.1 potassium-transporting ATPase subunit F [Duganella sp. Leaf61]KQQ47369.1 potassium-transporting ATPase subunit F [Duganella sp. Leaf126]MPQ59357.1 potassium-transporting ATPase subunit F [Duganella sp. FT27W]WQH03821.1 potassium-transporting ATPase subunit F [Duganella zoogloeoides]
MSIFYLIGGIASAGLLVYLVLALLKAEEL